MEHRYSLESEALSRCSDKGSADGSYDMHRDVRHNTSESYYLPYCDPLAVDAAGSQGDRAAYGAGQETFRGETPCASWVLLCFEP